MSNSASRFPQGEVVDAVIRYARKKHIPLVTGILSGYLDELNRHPELCIPSDKKEIFGRPLKRGEIPTARQLAEELLVCRNPGPVEEWEYGLFMGSLLGAGPTSLYHQFYANCLLGKGFSSPCYYSLSDLRLYSREYEYEDPSGIDFSHEAIGKCGLGRDVQGDACFDMGAGYLYEVQFPITSPRWKDSVHYAFHHNVPRICVPKLDKRLARSCAYDIVHPVDSRRLNRMRGIHRKDAPFSMNRFVCNSSDIFLNEVYGGAWTGEWQESFFAYTNRWGKLEVSRHVPRLKDMPEKRFFLYN